MEICEISEFLKVAQDRELDERIYAQWLVQLPMMNSDTYISFTDYRDKLTGANLDLRPAEDIIAEIEEAHRRAKMEN